MLARDPGPVPDPSADRKRRLDRRADRGAERQAVPTPADHRQRRLARAITPRGSPRRTGPTALMVSRGKYGEFDAQLRRRVGRRATSSRSRSCCPSRRGTRSSLVVEHQRLSQHSDGRTRTRTPLDLQLRQPRSPTASLRQSERAKCAGWLYPCSDAQHLARTALRELTFPVGQDQASDSNQRTLEFIQSCLRRKQAVR